MASRGLPLDEYVVRAAHLTMSTDARVQPIMDQHNVQQDGLLVESLLERVVVCGREQATLSFADVSSVRRTMSRMQARRAVLYIQADATVSNPVMLLASLSKIDIVRMSPAPQISS